MRTPSGALAARDSRPVSGHSPTGEDAAAQAARPRAHHVPRPVRARAAPGPCSGCGKDAGVQPGSRCPRVPGRRPALPPPEPLPSAARTAPRRHGGGTRAAGWCVCALRPLARVLEHCMAVCREGLPVGTPRARGDRGALRLRSRAASERRRRTRNKASVFPHANVAPPRRAIWHLLLGCGWAASASNTQRKTKKGPGKL